MNTNTQQSPWSRRFSISPLIKKADLSISLNVLQCFGQQIHFGVGIRLDVWEKGVEAVNFLWKYWVVWWYLWCVWMIGGSRSCFFVDISVAGKDVDWKKEKETGEDREGLRAGFYRNWITQKGNKLLASLIEFRWLARCGDHSSMTTI